MYSSRLSGNGAIAEKINSGGPPMQIATGIFPSGQAAAWSAPCLWICQCNPTSFGPNTWPLYIPRLCSPELGSLVTTSGRVMYRPPSIGHVFGIGSFVTSKSILTLWQEPFLTFFGGIEIASRASGKPVHGFLTIPPMSGFIRATSLSPTSVG